MEDQEVDELREEVTSLRRQLDKAKEQASTSRRRKLRSAAAVVLIVLGSILAPVATMVLFVRAFVLNTDRYVAIVTPLSKQPAVASAVATRVTNQLFSTVDVKQEIQGALPPRADFVAAPLTTALKGATQTTIRRIVLSDQFQTVWEGANRRAHQALVGVLTGKGPSAIAADKSGTVTLDLHTVVVQAVDRLDARGITVFDKVPVDKVTGTITLFEAPGLVKAQRATRLLNSIAFLLPVLCVASYAGAIALSWRRRRAALASGLALAASMAVLAITLGILRSYLLDAAVGHSLDPAAAGVLFNAVLATPRAWLRILFGLGLLVALVAWLQGPSAPAVAVRRWLVEAGHWIRREAAKREWDLGVPGRWLRRYEGLVDIALAFAALLVLVVWGSPGVGPVLVVLASVAGLMVLLHLFTRRLPPPGPAIGK